MGLGLNILEYVFPVLGGPSPEQVTVALGTAFSIGGGSFITAAHCVKEGREMGWHGLGFADLTTRELKACWIESYLMEEALDVAVLYAPALRDKPALKWRLDLQVMGEDIVARISVRS